MAAALCASSQLHSPYAAFRALLDRRNDSRDVLQGQFSD